MAAQPAAADEPVPFPLSLGGAYSLTDQHGRTRTEADPKGRAQLLFFGYANCAEICSVALPQMVQIEAALRARGFGLTPVLITVDPARDTVAHLGPAMARLGPGFIGLTGSDAALAEAYAAFAVESSEVFEDPAGGKVYAHGSLLYLLDGQGKLLTLLPPILSTERMVEVIAGYLQAG